MRCRFSEVDVLIHSLFKHDFGIMRFIFDLVEPCVATLSTAFRCSRWLSPCPRHLTWLSEFTASLDGLQNLILVIYWNEIIDGDVQRIHRFGQDGSKRLSFKCFVIGLLRFILVQTTLLFIDDGSYVEYEIFILARVWLKLVLVHLSHRVPFLSYRRNEVVQFWLLRQEASPSGCFVQEIANSTCRFVGLSISLRISFILSLLGTLPSGNFLLFGRIIIFQSNAVLNIQNLHLLELLLEEYLLGEIVATAVVIRAFDDWALVLTLVLVQLVDVRGTMRSIYYDYLLKVRATVRDWHELDICHVCWCVSTEQVVLKAECLLLLTGLEADALVVWTARTLNSEACWRKYLVDIEILTILIGN